MMHTVNLMSAVWIALCFAFYSLDAFDTPKYRRVLQEDEDDDDDDDALSVSLSESGSLSASISVSISESVSSSSSSSESGENTASPTTSTTSTTTSSTSTSTTSTTSTSSTSTTSTTTTNSPSSSPVVGGVDTSNPTSSPSVSPTGNPTRFLTLANTVCSSVNVASFGNTALINSLQQITVSNIATTVFVQNREIDEVDDAPSNGVLQWTVVGATTQSDQSDKSFIIVNNGGTLHYLLEGETKELLEGEGEVEFIGGFQVPAIDMFDGLTSDCNGNAVALVTETATRKAMIIEINPGSTSGDMVEAIFRFEAAPKKDDQFEAIAFNFENGYFYLIGNNPDTQQSYLYVYQADCDDGQGEFRFIQRDVIIPAMGCGDGDISSMTFIGDGIFWVSCTNSAGNNVVSYLSIQSGGGTPFVATGFPEFNYIGNSLLSSAGLISLEPGSILEGCQEPDNGCTDLDECPELFSDSPSSVPTASPTTSVTTSTTSATSTTSTTSSSTSTTSSSSTGSPSSSPTTTSSPSSSPTTTSSPSSSPTELVSPPLDLSNIDCNPNNLMALVYNDMASVGLQVGVFVDSIGRGITRFEIPDEYTGETDGRDISTLPIVAGATESSQSDKAVILVQDTVTGITYVVKGSLKDWIPENSDNDITWNVEGRINSEDFEGVNNVNIAGLTSDCKKTFIALIDDTLNTPRYTLWDLQLGSNDNGLFDPFPRVTLPDPTDSNQVYSALAFNWDGGNFIVIANDPSTQRSVLYDFFIDGACRIIGQSSAPITPSSNGCGAGDITAITYIGNDVYIVGCGSGQDTPAITALLSDQGGVGPFIDEETANVQWAPQLATTNLIAGVFSLEKDTVVSEACQEPDKGCVDLENCNEETAMPSSAPTADLDLDPATCSSQVVVNFGDALLGQSLQTIVNALQSVVASRSITISPIAFLLYQVVGAVKVFTTSNTVNVLTVNTALPNNYWLLSGDISDLNQAGSLQLSLSQSLSFENGVTDIRDIVSDCKGNLLAINGDSPATLVYLEVNEESGFIQPFNLLSIAQDITSMTYNWDQDTLDFVTNDGDESVLWRYSISCPEAEVVEANRQIIRFDADCGLGNVNEIEYIGGNLYWMSCGNELAILSTQSGGGVPFATVVAENAIGPDILPSAGFVPVTGSGSFTGCNPIAPDQCTDFSQCAQS